MRAVHAAGDYASEVCVPLALRYTMEGVLIRQSLSQLRYLHYYTHKESANFKLRTTQKAHLSVICRRTK